MNLAHVRQEARKALVSTNAFYLLNFLGRLVLVRMLTPEDFGSVALALGLMGLIEIGTTFSIQTVYLQRRSTESLTAAVLQMSVVNVLLKLLVTSAVFLVLASQYSANVWHLFAMILAGKVVAVFGSLLIASLDKDGKFFVSSVITNLANTAALVVAIVVVAAGGGTYGLVMREALPPFLMLLAAAWMVRGFWPRSWLHVNRRQLRSVAAGALQMYALRAAETSYNRLPLILVESVFGLHFLGLLTQSIFLVTSVQRITSVLNQQVALPFFSRHRNNRKDSRDGFRLLLLVSAGLGLPTTLLLLFFPEPVVRLLWGAEWLSAAPLVASMSVLAVVLPVFTLIRSRIQGIRMNNVVTTAYLTGLVLLVAALWLVANASSSYTVVGLLFVASYIAMTVICALFLWRGVRADGIGAVH